MSSLLMAAVASLLISLAPAGADPNAALEPPAVDPLALYRAREQLFRAAARQVAPCVVTLETVGGTQPPSRAIPRSQPSEKPRGHPPALPPTGSGFIIADGPTTGLIYAADGLILTSAFNFVREPSVITVTLADGRRFVGELLAKDEIRRLAMVKIEATGLPTPVWVQAPAEVRVGQTALALGRGFGGAEVAISAGIISGRNRQSGLAIQTDAKLSPANFGGPLIDLEGRVLGLCVPMGMGTGPMAGVEWYDSGIGFAIPFRQADKSARSLAEGHALRRGLIGVQIDLRYPGGVRVGGIADPSPARRSAMQVGDVIIALDGRPVADYPALRRIMIANQAGQRVIVRVKRDDRQLDLRLILAVPEDLGPVPGRD